jgi:biopolymer transport protein ExbB
LCADASAQNKAKPTEAERRAQAALEAKEPLAAGAAKSPSPQVDLGQIPKMDLWDLTIKGGPIMIPIGLFSVLVVTLAFERALALRRRNVLPRRFVHALKGLSHPQQGVDPRQVLELCKQYRSSASRVVRMMLVKANRPHAELREAVQEVMQREADQLGGGSRWLTLSASVAPMLGLLGTVQGMIMAFFITAHLPIGANKAEYLAQSIYVALVTTFGGLVVAIPAAILAHLFNGRILKLFRELDELLLLLESQLRRYRRYRRLVKVHAAASRPEPPPIELGSPYAEPPRPPKLG